MRVAKSAFCRHCDRARVSRLALTCGLHYPHDCKYPKELAEKISNLLPKNAGRKSAELVIAALASLFDILLANNTVAIIFSGSIAKELAKKMMIYI